MSPQAARKLSVYEQLMALPEGLTGEIINGQLRAQPRPSWAHGLAASRLGADLEGPYGRGRGGPGGWWIIDEPEVHLVLDTEVVVPDIAGWRRERMPIPPQGHKIQIVPDWICEIFSPSSKSTEREEKMPLYAHYGVQFAWLVDPKTRTLEAYGLAGAVWHPIGVFRDDDTVTVAPIDAIVIRLADLWC
ncbi:Uma2 family endonuclease [Thiorhodococcus minor]|uniref:Uma2 family endonuclease n=1 Tax=Thiorhodococcus minor TaxID=57489 RepID=A0A6M0JV53_9GAMM|nr:Uma2 family endonuclease [Thiorhodococcus minor]NEV61420.1 Uma2 family endonuclease [Thiorhodococcus minor]